MATFNALSGPELIAYILDKIKTDLEASGEFGGHVTFPWFKLDYEVKVLCYPKQDITDEPKVKVVGAAAEGAPETDSKVTKISNTHTVDTPDQARVETKQPVPTQAVGKGGVLFDKPVEIKPPAKGK